MSYVYGVFRKFNTFWFPREMACLQDKHCQIEAKVENISAESSPDPSLLVPPFGAEERPASGNVRTSVCDV